MKKFSALLLTAVLLFSLSACDNYAGEADKNSTPAPQSTPSDIQTDNNNPSAPTPSSPSISEAKITRDRAIEIALEKAKLQKADIRDLEAELDYEKGILVWEVDFDYQNLDYSYDINADTGAVILEEIEKDDK
ncbi:MAG: hypothetical protein E7545_00250 [Ruminococcaceae bacterium]|nr:hypothetical protein [Oscillospiraceae bacterium]